MLKRILFTLVCIVGLIALVAGIFFCTLPYSVVIPEEAWHIEGRVLDSHTNVIPGVTIAVKATKKVTAYNNFFGTLPKEERTNHMTDLDGKFVFNLEAIGVQMAFAKVGFEELITNVEYVNTGQSDSTNRNLQIILQTE